MFKNAKDLEFKTKLLIVLQGFSFPCQVFPDKLLWKYKKIFSKKNPSHIGDRVEEGHKFWEEEVDKNSKGTGWQNVRVQLDVRATDIGLKIRHQDGFMQKPNNFTKRR